MTEETSAPAAGMPAAQEQQPAQQTPAEHYQEPAHETPAEEHDYDEQFGHEEHESQDLGEIFGDKPKKASGAQRAKKREEFLINQHQERESQLMHELREREEQIAKFQRDFAERDERDYQSQAERRAEALRALDEAHFERLDEAREAIADFDRVMSKMEGVQVHEDLLEAIKESDKSPLLAYHLATHREKLDELNHMSPTARARELGRLEATLKLPEGKKHTTAPPPPSRISGGADPHARLEDVGDMGTFAKRLLKDLSDRKKR